MNVTCRDTCMCMHVFVDVSLHPSKNELMSPEILVSKCHPHKKEAELYGEMTGAMEV